MSITEFQEKASRTLSELNGKQEDNLHMVLGMVTESAELADVYKKNLAYKKDIDIVNVKEEIGDLLWYVVNFCTINKLDIGEILATNIAKLQLRYPERFEEHMAINRDITKERELLENKSNNIL